MSQEQPRRYSEAELLSKQNDYSSQSQGQLIGNASTIIRHASLSSHVVGESKGDAAFVERSGGSITIGEALEATCLTSGHKPVDYSDAAAIQAAEVRASGRTSIIPGGVAAAAQSAATRNARATKDEDKTKLHQILSDASSKLPADKSVTRRDAEGVIGAELRNDPNLCTRPGGVAASIAAAARLNQTISQTSTITTSVTHNVNDDRDK